MLVAKLSLIISKVFFTKTSRIADFVERERERERALRQDSETSLHLSKKSETSHHLSASPVPLSEKKGSENEIPFSLQNFTLVFSKSFWLNVMN